MRLRNLFLLAVVILLLFGLTGCFAAQAQKQEHIESLGGTYATMTTNNLNDSRTFSVELKEGFCIGVNATVDSGALHLEISQEGKEPIYTGRLTDERFSFRVNGEPGTYSLKIRGEKFAGSYRIDWAVKK